MRVAFLTVGDTLRHTGGYLYHREVFAHLRAGGVAVDELVAAPADLAAQLAAAPALGQAFDPRPYDVVVVDALARAVCAPWLDAWRLRRPLVAMVHELPSSAGGAADRDEIAREAPLLRADRLIAVSADGARILRERGVAAERITVASGGYDRLGPRAPRAAAPEPVVLCVAQWLPRKGLRELARAWARVARPGWRLELVGEVEADLAYAEAVRAALAEAPPGSVRVRGVLDDAALAAAYAGAALFALPSRFEGYGLVFAEAMAYGLPILACAIGPLPALVGAEAGLLVAPGDQEALVAALGRLMDDQPLRAHMAGAALARAAALPTWEACAARFLEALRAAVGAR
jgi:glycosyltransferase involved in cell wall biosynthesis